jgi:hypothetical protein
MKHLSQIVIIVKYGDTHRALAYTTRHVRACTLAAQGVALYGGKKSMSCANTDYHTSEI